MAIFVFLSINIRGTNMHEITGLQQVLFWNLFFGMLPCSLIRSRGQGVYQCANAIYLLLVLQKQVELLCSCYATAGEAAFRQEASRHINKIASQNSSFGGRKAAGTLQCPCMELLKREHSRHNTNTIITVCADQVTSCMMSHNEAAWSLPDLRGGAPTLYLQQCTICSCYATLQSIYTVL